ncbi:hypothetical protein B0H13DRAFT_2489692 [Mycena leptocephala]|nr:hypothetical protein B0H13DRAFT_2489692 [Mycena leptocephala]
MSQGVCSVELSYCFVDSSPVDSSPVDAYPLLLPPGFPAKTVLSSAPRLDDTQDPREMGLLSSCRLLGNARAAGISSCIGAAGAVPQFSDATHGPLSHVGSFGSPSVYLRSGSDVVPSSSLLLVSILSALLSEAHSVLHFNRLNELGYFGSPSVGPFLVVFSAGGACLVALQRLACCGSSLLVSLSAGGPCLVSLLSGLLLLVIGLAHEGTGDLLAVDLLRKLSTLIVIPSFLSKLTCFIAVYSDKTPHRPPSSGCRWTLCPWVDPPTLPACYIKRSGCPQVVYLRLAMPARFNMDRSATPGPLPGGTLDELGGPACDWRQCHAGVLVRTDLGDYPPTP